MNYFTLKIFLISFIISEAVFPQLNLSVSYEGYYDDNIFNNYEQINDFVNSFSLSSAYNIESDLNNFQLYYQGNLSSFRTNQFKTSDSHRFGVVETYLFAADDNPLNVGANFSLRNNRDDFEIYDFSQLSAYINYRHKVFENNYLLGGYLFNRNIFKNLTRFSYNEHNFFARWISAPGENLNITAGGEINYKKYVEQYDYVDYANDALLFKLALNFTWTAAENVQLGLYGELRNSPTEISRYLISEDYYYYEEEIFNDMYSNNGITAGAAINFLPFDQLLLSLEARYMTRNFTSLLTADMDGITSNVLRQDKQTAFGISAGYDLEFILQGLSLEAGWNYLINSSNDYFYDYTNNLIAASIIFGF